MTHLKRDFFLDSYILLEIRVLVLWGVRFPSRLSNSNAAIFTYDPFPHLNPNRPFPAFQPPFPKGCEWLRHNILL